MALWKKKKPLEEAIPQTDSAEVGTAADVEEVMKKYDRESNTRIWERTPKLLVRYFMALFSVGCLVVTLTSWGLPEQRLTLFLGFIIIIGYLNFPARKHNVRANTRALV